MRSRIKTLVHITVNIICSEMMAAFRGFADDVNAIILVMIFLNILEVMRFRPTATVCGDAVT